MWRAVLLRLGVLLVMVGKGRYLRIFNGPPFSICRATKHISVVILKPFCGAEMLADNQLARLVGLKNSQYMVGGKVLLQ